MLKHISSIVAASLVAASCDVNRQCETLSRDQALEMAAAQKVGMLRRSTHEYAANFESSEAAFVELNDGGYAAKVGFRGRDGRTLIALLEADCYIGWTAREAGAPR